MVEKSKTMLSAYHSPLWVWMIRDNAAPGLSGDWDWQRTTCEIVEDETVAREYMEEWLKLHPLRKGEEIRLFKFEVTDVREN